MWQCSEATWWPSFEPIQVVSLDQFQTDASGASWWPNLQTMDGTSTGGKVFYLQMAGGAIQIIFLFLTFLGDTIMRTSTVLFHPIPMNHMSG